MGLEYMFFVIVGHFGILCASLQKENTKSLLPKPCLMPSWDTGCGARLNEYVNLTYMMDQLAEVFRSVGTRNSQLVLTFEFVVAVGLSLFSISRFEDTGFLV